MIANYFKTSFRSLLANKLFSFINISGLAIGMTASILIITIIVHEFSFDRFHEKGERIFRAEKQFTKDGRHSLYANPEFAPALMAIDPQVENYVRTFSGAGRMIGVDNDHIFSEDQLSFADTSFFGIFSFPLLQGDYRMLEKPSTAIVSKSFARKYFNTTDVVGKILTMDRQYPLTIVGVAIDAPANSSIQFGIVASFATLLTMPIERDIVLNNSSGFPTYVLLRDKTKLADVNQSIKKTNYTNTNLTYSLAPLFENHFNFNFGSSATTRYAYTFLNVAGLILLLALINYINLTTARATTRAKEVGVRKVIGASRRSLSAQFYFESAVTTIVSFLLALVLIQTIRPFLVHLLGLTLDTDFLYSPTLLSAIGIVLVACILVAGSYPAIILPSFKAKDVLKGNIGLKGSNSSFRKTLIVFQFAVSVSLAICSVVMINQLTFLGSFDTGVNRKQVLVVPVKNLSTSQRHSFTEKLRSQSSVAAVSIASVALYKNSFTGVAMVHSPFNQEKIGVKWIVADNNFLSTLQIASPVNVSKPGIAHHLLNASAATAFGMNEESADKSLLMGGDHEPAVSGEITGAINDFNFESLRNPIQPLVLSIVPDSTSQIGLNPSMYIRLAEHRASSAAVPIIGSMFRQFSDGLPFEYYFLDDAFSEQQISERRLQQVFVIFASLALIIAGMGLFGLITFSSERRKKEMSIRKILGATITNVVTLISSEILLLLCLSVVIAVPAALYLSREWLNSFYYQAPITVGVIAGPVVAALSLAIAIIGILGMNVARANPSNNLKED